MASGARAAPGLVTPSLVLGGPLWHASLYGLVARFRVPCVHVPLLSCRSRVGALRVLRVETKGAAASASLRRGPVLRWDW